MRCSCCAGRVTYGRPGTVPRLTVSGSPLMGSAAVAGLVERRRLLCRRCFRDRSQLLHHRERVEDAPVLVGKTVVSEADDVDQLNINGLASSGHAHELTLVGSCPSNTCDDLVTTDKNVLWLHAQIWERRSVHVGRP